ncbi:MAG: hypothetical protein ACKO0Z_09020, partial [Betaproteobacteria bacterium]
LGPRGAGHAATDRRFAGSRRTQLNRAAAAVKIGAGEGCSPPRQEMVRIAVASQIVSCKNRRNSQFSEK